jgi:ubiquitin-conjugating enzyme (huntingtin interacting protein 2)
MDDTPFHLRGSFQGPQDSPYEGGNFEEVSSIPLSFSPRTWFRSQRIPHCLLTKLQDIVLPDGYPFSPPKVKFITKVYHPNISSSSGAISIDILHDQWSPRFTVPSLLISLQSFLCSPELCDPEPDDPVDAEVAKQFSSWRKAFEDTARNWTRRYATKSSDSSRP